MKKTEEYRRIQYLERKYKKNYTKGEQYTKEYSKNLKQKERIKNRVKEAHNIANHYQITSKTLHKKLSNMIYELKTVKTLNINLKFEKIISILIIFLLFEEGYNQNRRRIQKIKRESGVSSNDEMIVLCNLLKFYRGRQPLNVAGSVDEFYVNHDKVVVPVYLDLD